MFKLKTVVFHSLTHVYQPPCMCVYTHLFKYMKFVHQQRFKGKLLPLDYKKYKHIINFQ